MIGHYCFCNARLAPFLSIVLRFRFSSFVYSFNASLGRGHYGGVLLLSFAYGLEL